MIRKTVQQKTKIYRKNQKAKSQLLKNKNLLEQQTSRKIDQEEKREGTNKQYQNKRENNCKCNRDFKKI